MALSRIKKRKEKRQKVLMSLLLSFLMVASGFGIYLSGKGANQQVVKEHGLTFTIDYDHHLYRTKIDGRQMGFYYLPSAVQDLKVDPAAINLIKGSPAAVITFDPTLDPTSLQAIDVLRFDLTSSLQKPLINAVTQESASYALPVITCANATASLPVITIGLANGSSITLDGNCVSVLSNATGFLMARDRFLYDYLGVYEKS